MNLGRDLQLVLALTATSVALVLWPEAPVLVRGLVVTGYLLICPGYALSRALLPWGTVSRIDRFVFALGISLVVPILVGLGLHLTPWGIQATSWILSLGGVTATAVLVASWRDGRAGPRSVVDSKPFQVRLSAIAGPAITLLFVIGAYLIAREGALGQEYPGFSQFWLVPARTTDSSRIQLGVRSFEHDASQFTVRVEIDGTVAHQWTEIVLAPGESWERELTLSEGQPFPGRGPRLVSAYLYRTGFADIYRYTTLVLGEPTK